MNSDLIRAAQILDQWAALLFEDNSVDGEWFDDGGADGNGIEQAIRDHDEYRALADRLRLMALAA